MKYSDSFVLALYSFALNLNFKFKDEAGNTRYYIILIVNKFLIIRTNYLLYLLFMQPIIAFCMVSRKTISPLSSHIVKMLCQLLTKIFSHRLLFWGLSQIHQRLHRKDGWLGVWLSTYLTHNMNFYLR